MEQPSYQMLLKTLAALKWENKRLKKELILTKEKPEDAKERVFELEWSIEKTELENI